MITKLSDNELVSQVKIKVKEEKLITSEVLEYLVEINERKSYADYAPSLRKFCIKILGYTDSEAGPKCSAVYAISRLPEIKPKLKEGSLNLTSTALVGNFLKYNKVTDNNEFIKKIDGKNPDEVKNILRSQEVNPPPEKVSVTLGEHLLNKLGKIQKEYDDCTELEAIEALVDKHLEEKAHAKPKRESTRDPKNQRYIPREVKEHVDKRAQNQCEGISPVTGERCTCRTNLQYDHIKSVALGGMSTKDNLRKLCWASHQRSAGKQLGAEKMQPGAATTPPDVEKHHLRKNKKLGGHL